MVVLGQSDLHEAARLDEVISRMRYAAFLRGVLRKSPTLEVALPVKMGSARILAMSGTEVFSH